jgi:DNA-binding response OmpR family regulator
MLIGANVELGGSSVPRSFAMRPKKLILIVEERFELARHAFELLTLHGFEVDLACTSWRGLEMARLRRPDLIVVTLNIDEGLSADEAAADLGALHIPTIVLSGFGGQLAGQIIDALQPSAVLRNPVSDAALLAAVAAALAESPRQAPVKLGPLYEHG